MSASQTFVGPVKHWYGGPVNYLSGGPVNCWYGLVTHWYDSVFYLCGGPVQLLVWSRHTLVSIFSLHIMLKKTIDTICFCHERESDNDVRRWESGSGNDAGGSESEMIRYSIHTMWP